MHKYIHIFPDEKSVDYVVENCEAIAPQQHIYAIRNATSPFKHVQNTLAKAYALEQILKLANNPNVAYVYLHFLKEDALKFVKQYKGKAKLIWVFWGADGYILPKLDKISLLPKSKKLDEKARNPWYFLGLKKIALRINNSLKAKALQQALQKISYCATWVKSDYALIKPYAPHIEYINFSNYHIHQLVNTSVEVNTTENKHIFLGNSGYAPNNHIEAIEWLKAINNPLPILAPMSYGNKAYISLAKNEIKQHTKSFNCLETFVTKDKYHEILAASKAVFLNHTRQQAAGNALAALWFGIPLIMNAQSPLYKTFERWGLKLFTCQTSSSIENVFLSLEEHQANKSILEHELGKDKLKQMYKDLLFIQ